MGRKLCKRCNLEKDINNEFGFRNYKSSDGLIYKKPRSKCKQCESELTSIWQKRPEVRNRRREQRRLDRSLKSLIQNRIAAWKKKTPNSDLTTEYLLQQYDKQNGKCYYTGLSLKILKAHEWKDKFSDCISLDRLNPCVGYMQGNVVFCLYSVNTMKGKLTEQDFYDRIKKILRNHTRRFDKATFCSNV